MKRYIPVLALTSLLALSTPYSTAHADGFLGLFKKDKSVEQNETGEADTTIYNRKTSNSSSGPIFLNNKGGNRNTRAGGNSSRNTYNNYNRYQDDSAGQRPAHFQELAERLEAQEQANLAARHAERLRTAEQINKKFDAELQELKRKEQEKLERLRAEAKNLGPADYAPGTASTSSRTDRDEESTSDEESTKRYIYKTPEKSEATDRVFKNFR